jgi:hypothetical protein
MWDAEAVGPQDRVSLRRLSVAAGISEGTLRKWKDKGLRPDEHSRLSAAELLSFCRNHDWLAAAQRALPKLEALVGDARDGSAPPGLEDRAESPTQARAARATARAARAVAREHLQALVAAARAAEIVAREHREQIERLAAAYQLLDDELVDATGPVDIRG